MKSSLFPTRMAALSLLALFLGTYAFSGESSHSFALILEGRDLVRTGRYSQALAILRRAAAISEESGENLTSAIAFINIAEIHLLQGNPSEAVDFYHRALEKYRNIGHQSGMAVTQRRLEEVQNEGGEDISTSKRETMIDKAVERIRNRILAQQKETTPKTKGGSEYAAYIQGVKNAIVRTWKYPEEALRNRQEGRVEVEFTILEDGALEDVRVLHSSGSDSMDQEALRAVKAAAPFHRIPKNLGLKRMSIEFTFNYLLEKTP